MNIVLVGYMGSGKSSVAYQLSYRLQTPYIDSDKQIEREQHKTISTIFEESGEQAFRDMETAYLRRLTGERGRFILSTGGGMPVREENRVLLKQIGKVIYLKTDAETIYERLKEDTTRPLLQCEDPQSRIRDMLSERDPMYEDAADYIVVTTGKSVQEIVTQIVALTESATPGS